MGRDSVEIRQLYRHTAAAAARSTQETFSTVDEAIAGQLLKAASATWTAVTPINFLLLDGSIFYKTRIIRPADETPFQYLNININR